MLRNLSTGTEASATGESLNSGDVAVHPAARHMLLFHTKYEVSCCIIQLHPWSHDGKTKKPVVNKIEWEKLFAKRRNGMETIGQSGTGNSQDENTTPYGGMVDGGNRNQGRHGSGTRGRERKTTLFPVPVPYHSRPDLYRAQPCKK